MQPRTFVFGDIHGEIDQLNNVLAQLHLNKQDKLIFLGDYIDRGQDTYATIEKILELSKNHELVALMGNHEQMMLNSIISTTDKDKAYWYRNWINNGGDKALQSYQKHGYDHIPDHHIEFLKSLKLYHETDTHIFVHGTPHSQVAFNEFSIEELVWSRPSAITLQTGYNHISGKKVVCGHTPMGNMPLVTEGLIILDTACGYPNGILTALHLESGDLYQSV